MGARGRVGVEEVLPAFVSEAMSLVAVGLFGSVASSPGGTGKGFSVLLWKCVRTIVLQTRHLKLTGPSTPQLHPCLSLKCHSRYLTHGQQLSDGLFVLWARFW